MSGFSPLDLRQINDREFELLSDLIYTDEKGNSLFVIPAGFVTDLASVPSTFWGLFPPADRYSEAAVVHDWFIILAKGDKKRRKEADQLFLKLMKESNVHALRRYPMYWAVRFYSIMYGTWPHYVVGYIGGLWMKLPRWLRIILKYTAFAGGALFTAVEFFGFELPTWF